MTRSQRDWTAALVLLSAGLTALPGAQAAGQKHKAPAHGYKRTVSQHTVPLAQDPDVLGAMVSTVESLDPAFLTQPIAVITTRSNGVVRVVVETPPRGALASIGKSVLIARASYRGDDGSMETHPEVMPEVIGRIDLSLPLVAGTAIEQIAASKALTTAFVLIVQPAGTGGYNVIYAPIPYSPGKLQSIPVKSVLPSYTNPETPTATPGVPALPPIEDNSGPPPQMGSS